MSKTRSETEAEEIEKLLKRAAEAGKKVVEDFKRSQAKRDRYEVMERMHRRMWRDGERE